MNKLFEYQDYVNNLSHENELVRGWAFESLTERFPDRCIDDVAVLVGDESDDLAFQAVRMLARQGAAQHAPAILKRLKSSQGALKQECIRVLGLMGYEPAFEDIRGYFFDGTGSEFLREILFYFGNVRTSKSRDVLLSTLNEFFDGDDDKPALDTAVDSLLRHNYLEDVRLVLSEYFEPRSRTGRKGAILAGLASAAGGLNYYIQFTGYDKVDLLKRPRDDFVFIWHYLKLIHFDKNFWADCLACLEKKQYELFVKNMLNEAELIASERKSYRGRSDRIDEMLTKDDLCLCLLKEIYNNPGFYKMVNRSKRRSKDLFTLIAALFLALLQRGFLLAALSPDAGPEELIQAVKTSETFLPDGIKKKVIEQAPVQELIDALFMNLATWGGIWSIRLMGGVGDKAFIPSLTFIIKSNHPWDFIYEEAVRALNGLDESAHEALLAVVESREVDDWAAMSILKRLPYSEAFDTAMEIWENEGESDMDSYDVFAAALAGIGDPRGIEVLRRIYIEEYDDLDVGEALETLCRLHNVDLPELPLIIKAREMEERDPEFSLPAEPKQDSHVQSEFAFQDDEYFEEPVIVHTKPEKTYIRETPKVGRNEPCPCGSGKKYKKCCGAN